ncbi:MAG: hypothetical protein K8I03_00405 [Ignavibacteria bacterium]|nr:hypothetical protein [Ignavibacteria bacterium]
MKSAILILLAFVFACTAPVFATAQTAGDLQADTCRSMKNARKLKNKSAVILGKLQKYTPIKAGKGQGRMFWQWEVSLQGGGRIPVVSKDKSDGESIVFDEYENLDVVIYGSIFYGIVIGDSDPNHQSATGYRIDADGIRLAEESDRKTALDTCWIYLDIQEHLNVEAIVAGKLIEYKPPHDGSKLGDEKIWDYELQIQDGFTIPLQKTSENLELAAFIDKDIFLKAFIKYGIIFGDTNTANMEGYRLDPIALYYNERGYEVSYFDKKIRIDLEKFTSDGYRVHPGGEKSAINYEFCIPASDSVYAEVLAIDPTAGVLKGSKGRSGCSEKEWLVIGSSRQPGFKDVLKKLARLEYIRKITETFWE